MSQRLASEPKSPWLKTGVACLCLYLVGVLAGCNKNSGTPSQTLSGSVTGTYTSQATVPDVGTTYTLTGAGTVVPLGLTQAAGSFTTVGFIASGNATGQLTLTNANGSVILGLKGPTQVGPATPPGTFQYTVTGTTGSNQHVNSSGNITLVLTAGATAGSGQFTMTFTP